MPTIDSVYGSTDALRAEHLPPGASVPVTVQAVTAKTFDDGSKLELRFAGKQRVLLCNKTNASLIAKYLGERDYSQWPGKVVWLKASETEFKGDIVPCIRVDLHPPQTTPSGALGVDPPAAQPAAVPDYRAEAAALTPGEDVPF
ncbi:MAG: hypothetical protein AAFV43_12030 [Planctomycetota bacterium]